MARQLRRLPAIMPGSMVQMDAGQGVDGGKGALQSGGRRLSHPRKGMQGVLGDGGCMAAQEKGKGKDDRLETHF